MMTPLGVQINTTSFFYPTIGADGHDSAPERHNVDKNMLTQDPSLISQEITLKARVAAATALSYLVVFWPSSVSLSYLLQIFLCF
jgi:TATA-binding protein-associated factor